MKQCILQKNPTTQHHSCTSSIFRKYVYKNVVHCKTKAYLHRAVWWVE